MLRRFVAGCLALLACLVLGPANAAAHGDATLEGPDGPVPAGQRMTLAGRGFVPDEIHRIVLRGTLDEVELTTVAAGADSTFTEEVTVPRDARPGQYRIVALAPDGDEVATLDVPVTASSDREPEESVAGADSGGQGSGARAGERVIRRNRAGVEWGVIGLVIGLAGGLGLGLLRRS